MRRRRHDGGVEAALANFALTFAKALLVFCVVLFLMISPKQGNDGTKPKAEYLITIDWTGALQYDVDIWLRLPDGNIIYYSNKESGIAFLERDDLGHDCVSTTVNAKSVNICEEIIVLRGIVRGDYVVALHLYSANGTTAVASVSPVNVHAQIERLNPTTEIVWQGHVTMTTTREEKGVVRFTIGDDGTINDYDTEQLPPVVYGTHQ